MIWIPQLRNVIKMIIINSYQVPLKKSFFYINSMKIITLMKMI